MTEPRELRRRRERWLLGVVVALFVVLVLCCILFFSVIRSLGSEVDDLAEASNAATELTAAQERLKELRDQLNQPDDAATTPPPAPEITMVAVGAEGTIVTSPDGRSWTRQSLGDGKFIFDVEWNGSMWVAVGAEASGGSGACGETYSSTDGYNWTVHDLGCPDILNGVGWNGTRWVAVGMFGQVFAAMDGMNWTPKQGLNSSSTLWEVEWDDPSGEWYAVGDGGSVFASSTAANWTTVTFPGSGQLRGLTTTGSDWFVVGDNGKLARSAVGTGAWNAVTVPVSTLLNDVEFNGSQFVAVGDPSGPNSVVMTSGNGNQWTPQAISTSNPLRGLAWTGTEWIVVGDASAIFTSPDGQQWTQQSTGLGTTTHDLHQVASK